MADDAEREATHKASRDRRPPWILLASAAVVLMAAAIIFSAAGPDRSRTTEYKDANPYAVNPRGAVTQKIAPNVDMPTAPKQR